MARTNNTRKLLEESKAARRPYVLNQKNKLQLEDEEVDQPSAAAEAASVLSAAAIKTARNKRKKVALQERKMRERAAEKEQKKKDTESQRLLEKTVAAVNAEKEKNKKKQAASMQLLVEQTIACVTAEREKDEAAQVLLDFKREMFDDYNEYDEIFEFDSEAEDSNENPTAISPKQKRLHAKHALQGYIKSHPRMVFVEGQQRLSANPLPPAVGSFDKPALILKEAYMIKGGATDLSIEAAVSMLQPKNHKAFLAMATGDSFNTKQPSGKSPVMLRWSYNFLVGTATAKSERPIAAVYKLGSFIEHSCNPNAEYAITEEGELVVCATSVIDDGDEITFPCWPWPGAPGTEDGKEKSYLCKCDCTECIGGKHIPDNQVEITAQRLETKTKILKLTKDIPASSPLTKKEYRDIEGALAWAGIVETQWPFVLHQAVYLNDDEIDDDPISQSLEKYTHWLLNEFNCLNLPQEILGRHIEQLRPGAADLRANFMAVKGRMSAGEAALHVERANERREQLVHTQVMSAKAYAERDNDLFDEKDSSDKNVVEPEDEGGSSSSSVTV